jgi:hypothetical protein
MTTEDREFLGRIRVDIRNVCVRLSYNKATDNGPEHKELCRIGAFLAEALAQSSEVKAPVVEAKGCGECAGRKTVTVTRRNSPDSISLITVPCPACTPDGRGE